MRKYEKKNQHDHDRWFYSRRFNFRYPERNTIEEKPKKVTQILIIFLVAVLMSVVAKGIGFFIIGWGGVFGGLAVSII
jgi:hypothetical protein